MKRVSISLVEQELRIFNNRWYHSAWVAAVAGVETG